MLPLLRYLLTAFSELAVCLCDSLSAERSAKEAKKMRSAAILIFRLLRRTRHGLALSSKQWKRTGGWAAASTEAHHLVAWLRCSLLYPSLLANRCGVLFTTASVSLFLWSSRTMKDGRRESTKDSRMSVPPDAAAAATSTTSTTARRRTNGAVGAAAAVCLLAIIPEVSAFAPMSTELAAVFGRSMTSGISARRRIPAHVVPSSSSSPTTRLYSDWSDFSYIDDDDDLLDSDSMKNIDFADENDPQELKAQVGSSLEPPELDWFGDPIEVPLGVALPLEPETIQGLLAACREEIGTMFGYSAENRGVGITGGVDFVELDGPVVVLRLKGRFWHQRTTVLERVAAYLQGRCPEIVDVVVEDEWQLTDEANDAAM